VERGGALPKGERGRSSGAGIEERDSGRPKPTIGDRKEENRGPHPASERTLRSSLNVK